MPQQTSEEDTSNFEERHPFYNIDQGDVRVGEVSASSDEESDEVDFPLSRSHSGGHNDSGMGAAGFWFVNVSDLAKKNSTEMMRRALVRE